MIDVFREFKTSMDNYFTVRRSAVDVVKKSGDRNMVIIFVHGVDFKVWGEYEEVLNWFKGR